MTHNNPNTNKNSQNPPQKPKTSLKQKFNSFVAKLNSIQKLLIILILTALIVSATIFGIAFVTDPLFRRDILNLPRQITSNNNQQKAVDNELKNLQANLDKLTNTDQYYKEYTIEDLDIYPTAWMNRNFDLTEQKNVLISGAKADPDKDSLTNQQEYFAGSNPKKAFTLCDGVANGAKPIETSPFVCDGRNDGDLYRGNLSPLSGLDLDIIPKFTVLNQDFAMINSLRESVETASREGNDYPELYQLSRKIDLTSQLNLQEYVAGQDEASTILKYRQDRINVSQEFVTQDAVTPISQIYTLTKAEQFDAVIKKYQSIVTQMAILIVPPKYKVVHQANLLMFKKIIELYSLRRDYIIKKKTEDPEFQIKSKEKSIETIWAFRRLNEEEKKQDLQQDALAR